jgi:hypothetical protein
MLLHLTSHEGGALFGALLLGLGLGWAARAVWRARRRHER